MADLDTEQFNRLFLQESSEQLETMEKIILDLEEKGESPEAIDEIFRLVHSLKGSAGSMGYNKISTLAHEMENMLEELRVGNASLTDELIDLLFISLDTLKALKDNVEKGQEDADDVTLQHVLERYKQIGFSTGDADSGQKRMPVKLYITPEEKVLIEERAKAKNLFLVSFNLLQQQDMQSMVAFLVVTNIKKIAEIVKTAPMNLDEVEGDLPEFILLIGTEKDGEEVTRFLEKLVDKEEFQVFSWQEIKEEKAGKLIHEAKDAFQARDTRRDSIRVDIEKLDELMKLVGELVIDKERLIELGKTLKARLSENWEAQALLETIPHIDFIATELHESVMDIRMYPVGSIFQRFPRLVRDICRQTGKEVQITLSGEDTELDRTILQEVFDPMVHLIRNAIDHGIELPDERIKKGKSRQATLALNAWQEENHIVLEVSDDGRGIDLEKIKERAIEKHIVNETEIKNMDEEDILELIFLPGFSTREIISDISGRGVGMDVVKTNIEELNGHIELKSKAGQGTSVKIILPLTLAITKALMVKEGKNDYAVPLSSVIETINITGEEGNEIRSIKGREVFYWRENVVPVIRLRDFFNLSEDEEEDYIVLVNVKDRTVGITVKDVLGEQEIVIKSLGSYMGSEKIFGELMGISGATIKGDGRIALILDVQGILKSYRKGGKIIGDQSAGS